MKRTIEIPKEMLDNENIEAFKNDFFKRFILSHKTVKLSDDISKNYKFPTFYGDVTCAIGIFLCSYKKAEELVAHELHKDIKPIKMTRGRALIAFSCYEYKNVMNVAPYNEVAMAIPVMVNAKCNPPLLPMIMSGFSHFGYFIAGMPVTSYENQIRGNTIWGLPKITQDIDMKMVDDDFITTIYEESGEPYLTIKVPTKGKATEFNETSNLYSRLNGNLLQSETNFKAKFNVIKHMDLLLKKNAKPERTYIEIGNTKSAEFLKELEIEEHPFQLRYAEHMSSCFDLPKSNVPDWFEKIK